MGTASLFDHLPPADRELAVAFFGEFAMAEYQLKALGYIKRGKEDAQADWDAFANSVRGTFRTARDDNAFAIAWRDLTTNPPRKQVIRQGRLSWRETQRAPGQSDEDWGLLLVRRVRNNLFHGGKFMLDEPLAHGRDRYLVNAARVVLRAAMVKARPRRRPRAA